jgi:quercetin dioxygenase-like cupin family protein
LLHCGETRDFVDRWQAHLLTVAASGLSGRYEPNSGYGRLMDGLTLSDHQTLVVRMSSPELLDVETTYQPGGDAPPAHFHPDQDEYFEVLDGELRIQLDGSSHVLRTGDAVHVSRGIAHQMWNDTDQPARVRWQTSPRGRTEQWFRAIDQLHRESRASGKSKPDVLAFATLLAEFRDSFRLAVLPDALMRPAVSVVALVGRLRGQWAS